MNKPIKCIGNAQIARQNKSQCICLNTANLHFDYSYITYHNQPLSGTLLKLSKKYTTNKACLKKAARLPYMVSPPQSFVHF